MIRIALTLTLLAAAFFSLRAARADWEFRLHTPDGVAKAVELAPGNAEFLELRALQLDYDGADSTSLLERAANLNPTSSAPRLRLGLAAEARGDFGSAEKWMLEAARVDRQFEPRWTLASYYFRRENGLEFWKWIRSALEISYGDHRPAFDLCWRMSGHAEEILARGIPRQHDVMAAYLAYLLDAHRTDGATAVAMSVAAARDPADREVLLAACDALIAAGSVADAWNLWTAMGFGAVTFDAPRVNRGFDWQRVESPGVGHLEIDQPRVMHRITFSGSQAESCELLRRAVKLEPGRRYTLRWHAQPGFPGVEWRIGGEHAPLKAGELQFTASDRMLLTLTYQRPQGEVRAEGTLEIWDVEIQ